MAFLDFEGLGFYIREYEFSGMDIDELMRRLFELYPEGYTDDFRDPFFVLISTVMSHRTRDDVTYPCSKEAF